MSKVILGCKVPNGFVMEVDGISKSINGAHTEYGTIAYDRGEQIGITSDVDKSLWDAWRAKHADHPLCKNGFVFEAKSEASLKAQAKETKEVKTGLEQKTPEQHERSTGAKPDNKVADE